MALSLQTTGTLSYLMALFLETISSMCAQALQDVVPPFELNFSRYFAQLIFSLILNKCRKIDTSVMLSDKGFYVVTTSVLSTVYNVSFYSAASRLPLGIMIMVNTIAQIVIAVVIQKLVFRDTISIFKLIVIPFIFGGLYIMLEPQLVQTEMGEFNNSTVNGENDLLSREAVGIVLCIVAAMSGTFAVAITNSKLSEVPLVTMSLWIALIGTVESCILAVYINPLKLQLSLYQGLLFFAHSSTAAISVMFAIHGAQHVSLISWAIIETLRIILNIITQYTIMRSIVPVTGNVYEIVGIVITLICIIYSIGLDFYTERVNADDKW